MDISCGKNITPVRIGIIGTGVMGGGHTTYLLNGEVKNAVLTCLCDIDSSKFTRFTHSS